MDQRFISLYMDIARRVSEMSRAIRLKVGTVIIKDDRIISMSWNGTPAGWDNSCEDRKYEDITEILDKEILEDVYPYIDEYGKRYSLKTKPEVLHSEMNALMKLARSSESGNGATLFCTHAPCLECAKGMLQAGIHELYFEHSYRNTDGLDFLAKSNKIQIYKVDF